MRHGAAACLQRVIRPMIWGREVGDERSCWPEELRQVPMTQHAINTTGTCAWALGRGCLLTSLVITG
jgi:hypothetical protein